MDLYAKSRESDKYGAINLKHKNTIEIRIFKGTLNVDTFYSTLEFVNIMAHISKETDIYDIQFVTWDKIISRFSDELNQYIIDREEIIKKEEKEKVNQMINDRSSAMGYASVSSPSPYEYRRELSGSFDILLSEAQRQVYEDILRTASMNISTPSFELNCEPVNQPVERTEEEIIKNEINELKIRVRRSNNGLEITNLNRQIAELENRLRRLRISNRNSQ